MQAVGIVMDPTVWQPLTSNEGRGTTRVQYAEQGRNCCPAVGRTTEVEVGLKAGVFFICPPVCGVTVCFDVLLILPGYHLSRLFSLWLGVGRIWNVSQAGMRTQPRMDLQGLSCHTWCLRVHGSVGQVYKGGETPGHGRNAARGFSFYTRRIRGFSALSIGIH